MQLRVAELSVTLKLEVRTAEKTWMWWTIRPQWSPRSAGMRRRVKRHQIGVSPFIFVPLKKKKNLKTFANSERSNWETSLWPAQLRRHRRQNGLLCAPGNFNNFEVSRFDCSAKIIMVAALWPVMKVAEVTPESRPGGCVLFIRALKHYNNQKPIKKPLVLFIFHALLYTLLNCLPAQWRSSILLSVVLFLSLQYRNKGYWIIRWPDCHHPWENAVVKPFFSLVGHSRGREARISVVARPCAPQAVQWWAGRAVLNV